MTSPHDLFIDGQWRPASDGRRFAVHDPADGSELAQFAAATEADCLAAVDAAADALADWKLFRHPDGRARAVRRPHRRRERQGVRRRARRGRLRCRVLPLVRRGGGPDRRRLPALPVGRQDDRGQAGPDRGVGADHALELPCGDGDPQDRTGAGGRLFGGAEAGQPDSAHRRLRCRGTAPCGCPGWCRQPGDAGARRSRGERDAAPPRSTQALLHRLDRGRPRAAARGRRPGGQLVDGTRGQRAVHRAARCRSGRRRRGRDGREDAQRRSRLYRGQPVLRARLAGRGVQHPHHGGDEGAHDGSGRGPVERSRRPGVAGGA